MEHLTATTLTTLATTAGWVGAGGTVIAYSLLTARRIEPDSRTFQGLNAAGAGLLALSAASHQSWPSTTVNLTWMLIGLAALLGVGRWLRPAGPDTDDTGADTDARAEGFTRVV